LQAAGCGVAVADAHPEALAAADVVLQCSGGRGALRELSDMILERRRTR
jgi:3-deoxy-D-manno-octulosonate 8-phosphate phosphatase KdsC-like HAD superfamily phosphatase